MGVSIIYEFLDEFYQIRHGINTDQLHSGTCPRCEKTSSDLRLYCKTEEEMQELEDRGDIEDASLFNFGSCHHCGLALNFFHFAKFHSGLTLDETREMVDSDDEFIRTKDNKEEVDERPFPPCVELENDVLQIALDRGITEDMIQQYGILFSVGNFEYAGRDIYYKNRILFPIYSRFGEICGFQGRSVVGSGAKYLTAPWMQKSDVLYGCHEYPTGVSHLLLVEGVMDKFGWHKIGINAVASFGKSISSNQVDILLDINPDVLYLAYDRDAIEKSFEFCERNLHRFKSIKIIRMPVGRDSDEMTKDELTVAIVNAVTYSWETKITFMMEDNYGM
jgi:hypothetical protein